MSDLGGGGGYDDCGNNLVSPTSAYARLFNEPVDSSDDSTTFIQSGIVSSGTFEFDMQLMDEEKNACNEVGVDMPDWTTITKATARARVRLWDKVGVSLPAYRLVGIEHSNSNIHTKPVKFNLSNPETGDQCSDDGWETLEVELEILDDDADKWFGTTSRNSYLHARSTKALVIQISAYEICLEGY
tara:strand:- start:4078 stop:4635 length:558 start_codon:yes stop_codon:yes gene_type:complete